MGDDKRSYLTVPNNGAWMNVSADSGDPLAPKFPFEQGKYPDAEQATQAAQLGSEAMERLAHDKLARSLLDEGLYLTGQGQLSHSKLDELVKMVAPKMGYIEEYAPFEPRASLEAGGVSQARELPSFSANPLLGMAYQPQSSSPLVPWADVEGSALFQSKARPEYGASVMGGLKYRW